MWEIAFPECMPATKPASRKAAKLRKKLNPSSQKNKYQLTLTMSWARLLALNTWPCLCEKSRRISWVLIHHNTRISSRIEAEKQRRLRPQSKRNTHSVFRCHRWGFSRWQHCPTCMWRIASLENMSSTKPASRKASKLRKKIESIFTEKQIPTHSYDVMGWATRA